MRPSSGRILFAVMSATQSASVVRQLAGLLEPHKVLVHHDFTKRADFGLSGPNIELIEDPRPTGWGTWGFADAILHTMRSALERHDFEYFQLLSPTCLPIRPIEEFEDFVASDPADAHVDLIDVESDEDVLMTFGYRSYLAGDTLRYRLLRRARRWYSGSEPELVQTRSLSIFRSGPRAADRRLPVKGRLALALTRLAAAGRLGPHPFSAAFRPVVGSVWFGSRRRVCEYLVEAGRDGRLVEFFSGLNNVDEAIFPTLLANSGFRLGPSNHVISPFDEDGHPCWIDERSCERLVASGRFFARKFPDDPGSAARLHAIERCAHESLAR